MSVYNRILRRAELNQLRINEIRAQFDGTPKLVAAGNEVATAKWKRLVQQRVDAGVPRSQAVIEVAKNNPGLRERFVAEYNSKTAQYRQERHAKAVAEGRLITSPRPTGRPASGGHAKASFKALVEDLVQEGVPRHIAVSRVNRENPGLREQMVREANP